MKLSSLELSGFKSFYNRTVFRFSDGVTSLVGPNGCGKSNIVDAIVWVLGERGTKSLRVKEMGDVIFHGSNGRKPVNLAEVTLTLNDGAQDISIKRRIYRDGINEYCINGEIVRLKDVQDLTLGTGIGVNSYAIIEQGNIEYLAQMKPMERRVVIEETSGITRFQEKKREAFVRMEEVGANLDRVEDIRLEVNRNLEKALKEREVLLTYDRLQKRLREIDIDLLSDAYGKVSKKLEKLVEKRDELERERTAKDQEASNLKGQTAAKEAEISLTDRMARELETQIRGHEKVMENNLLELNFLKEEKERLEKTTGDLKSALVDGDARTAQYEKEIAEIRIRVGAEKKAEADLEAEKEKIALKRETTRELIDRLDRNAEEKRETLFSIVSALTDVRNQLAEIERIAREQKERETRRVAEEHRLGDRLAGLREKETLSRERLESARAKAGEIEEESRDIAGRKTAATQGASEIRSLVERLRGEKRGKEEVWRSLKGKTAQRSSTLPFKQLIDIVRVPKQAEATIERLFAREMEYHVFEERDRQKLAEVIQEKRSNFVFFPANGIFNLEGEFAEISVICVDSISEVFQRIDRGEQGIFVADGVCVDSRGFILTRSDGEKAKIREAQQKARLEKEIQELQKELDRQAAMLTGHEEAARKIEAAERAVRERRQANQRAIADAERELVVLQTEIASSEERLDQLRTEREFAEEEVQENTRETLDRAKAEHEVRKVDVEQDMRLLRAEQEKVKEAYEQVIAAEREQLLVIERKKNFIRSLEEEMGRKGNDVGRLATEKQSWTLKAAEIEKSLSLTRSKIVAAERSHDEAQTNTEALTVRLEEVKTQMGDLHLEKSRLQQGMETLHEEQKKIDLKREGIERDYAVLEERRQAVLQRLQSEFGLNEAKILTVADERRLELERQKISEELPRLGEVNFRSEKEYLELKERLEFLEGQKADLEDAVDSLRKTIAKIDSFSKELFLETFERVNAAFQRFAPMLFKGGKGMLALDSDGQGVELYVQPPGKKVVRMELLSGGEKALISLSFLLSLMETKPSPFTLMDEIDAPLDDANLVSLLDIMQEISKQTQVVLITHNRITMESSKTIYGITMEEDGISKTIAIKLA
jgi:chromosome segregation protein